MNVDYLLVMLSLVAICSFAGFLLTYFPFKSLRKKRAHSKKSVLSHPTEAQTKDSFCHAERIEPTLKAQDTLEKPSVISENGNAPEPLYHQKISEAHPEFIALYLIAPSNNPYTGYELWQSLMNRRLEYGEFQIFHRFSQTNTESSQIYGRHRIFSVANTAKPGHFDRVNIGGIRCPGLCFFIEADTTNDIQSAYQEMLATAGQLAKTLGGTLYNEKRQPIEL